MRIGIIGGVERIESRLSEVARSAGHDLEFHNGHMSSTSSNRLRSLVERADLVVIITSINSHAAVLQARDMARQSGRKVRILHRLGPSQLRALLN
jgi:hypothetical protein